jgi:NAD(P)-dependent dehydrogenase (short-subunit alcohol dehydrogenase family)
MSDSSGRRSGQDPREVQPRPPFPPQQQRPPGSDALLEPRADHGEESYRGYNRLQDKVALVTGADSGIGRAVALAFAREGADVLVSYLAEDQDAHETARLVGDARRRAVLMAGDIAEEAHCRELVERCVDEFGRIDVLVNNAAFQARHARIEELSAAELDFTFKTNIYAMFHLCKAAAPHMKPGSAIINTASIQAYQPSPSLLAYAATKGAVVTFTKALAALLIDQGIRVNAVAPGPVWTPLIPASTPPEGVEKFGGKAPIGRAAQPAELAPAYVFLACRDSTYVVGEVIGVGGGLSFG